MQKSYTMKRSEELRVLIATVKIKHRLTDAKLAKKLDTPLSTFNYWKAHTEKFPAGKIWLLEIMDGK